MTFRKTIFWLHLCSGCIAGAIILVMSVTGVLLTYEKQVLAWAERSSLRAGAASAQRRLEVQEVVDAVQRQRGPLPGGAMLTLRSDPAEPVEFRAGRQGAVYVNPYTGAVSASDASTARTVFQKITAWHRWLGVEGPGRNAAKAITGACNLAFLVLIMSGAYLWLPGKWSRQNVRAVAWFRPNLSGKARDFNWHNVFGLWTLIPLFFVVLTALPMSYTWANDLLYRLTGSAAPPSPGGRPGPNGPRGESPAVQVDHNRLWASALHHSAIWKSITARLPSRAGEPVTFTIDYGSAGQPQKRVTLTVNSTTGNIIGSESFADASAGRRLRMWSRFVHTGEYYGAIGQTIAGIASLTGVMLVWTGIALALRRFGAWIARRKRQEVMAA